MGTPLLNPPVPNGHRPFARLGLEAAPIYQWAEEHLRGGTWQTPHPPVQKELFCLKCQHEPKQKYGEWWPLRW